MIGRVVEVWGPVRQGSFVRTTLLAHGTVDGVRMNRGEQEILVWGNWWPARWGCFSVGGDRVSA